MSTSTKHGYFAAITKAGDVVDPSKPSTGSVVLRGLNVALDTDVAGAFVRDCARHTEGLLSDAEIKTKWAVTDADWAALANNAPLLDLVRCERDCRVFNGAAAREGAQQHFAKAPNVLGGILTDGTASPRHRIEAARELRQVATGADTAETTEKERFVVVINLGGGEKPLRYETEIEHRVPSAIDDGEKA